MPVNRSKTTYSPIPPPPKSRNFSLADSSHSSPCASLVRLSEKVAFLEQWRNATEVDLKDIREVISQVKLLMTLSVGGGGLSLLALVAFIVDLLLKK
jgi:hypothetical protein